MSEVHNRGFEVGEMGTGIEPPLEFRARDDGLEISPIDWISLSFGN